MQTAGSRLRSVGLAIACVCAFAALNVNTAFGTVTKTLDLQSEHETVAVGSPAYMGLALGGCVIFSEGVVTVNGANPDILGKATKNSFAECPINEKISGVITEAKLNVYKTMTANAKLTITEPGPCIYLYYFLKGKFGATVSVEGTTVGKLKKFGSAKTCAETVTEKFDFDATPETLGEPFEAVIKTS